MENEYNENKKYSFNSIYKQYLYYIIIGIISFITLVFMPMIGSDANLGFDLPQTTAGWVVFITTRCCVSVINVLIFHSFMEQAKINVRDNEDYKKANDILKYIKGEHIKKPMAPEKWVRSQYLKKGTMLFISSILATFAISQAILSYDWMQLISYLLVVTMAIIFGILQMKKAEIYWTYEYYQFAIQKEEEIKEAAEAKKAEEMKEAAEAKKAEEMKEAAEAKKAEEAATPMEETNNA